MIGHQRQLESEGLMMLITMGLLLLIRIYRFYSFLMVNLD